MFSQRGTPVLSHGFDILKELPLAFSTGTRELSIRSMFESFRTRCHEEQHGEGKSFILVFAAFFFTLGYAFGDHTLGRTAVVVFVLNLDRMRNPPLKYHFLLYG